MLEGAIDAYIPAGRGEILGNYKVLLDAAGVDNKALIDLNGKPMINYVIEALDKSRYIRSITIFGLTADEINVETTKPLAFSEGGNTTFETLKKVITYFKNKENKPEYILSTSCDIPLITYEMIDRICKQINLDDDIELYYNIVWHKRVAELLPEVTKVPLKLKEGNMVFGDIHVFSIDVLDKGDRLAVLNRIMMNRKNFGAVIKFLSIKYFLKYMIRQLTLKDAGTRIMRVFDLKAGFLLCNIPEVCADLDYAKDLETFKIYSKQPPRKLTDIDTVVILTKEDLEKGKVRHP
jgi:CTP:molybdopterin cytidylyltransferase MocA